MQPAGGVGGSSRPFPNTTKPTTIAITPTTARITGIEDFFCACRRLRFFFAAGVRGSSRSASISSAASDAEGR